MDQNNDSKVEFEEEDQMLQASEAPHFEKKGMIGFVIKHSGGLIKDEKQANLILVVFIIIIVALTFAVIPN